MGETLSAFSGNREYFFYFVKRMPANKIDNLPEEVSIEMYKTPYTFLKIDGTWKNKVGNKMTMEDSLIRGVITALHENGYFGT